MIEGGLAGGSAAHHADQRRTVATRLVAEAKWLDAVAEDERNTAAYLEKLSNAYAILHDLKLDGMQGNIDHVVVGPGGAFVVVTRRFADPVNVRDGALFAGDRPLGAELAGLRAVAEQLAQLFGTPVAPVLGFHGGLLPATTPPTVDGVFICGAENLVRVITRASHTLLAPHKITDVTEKALPLLFNPGSVSRDELAPRPDPQRTQTDNRVPELALAPPAPAVSAAATPLDEAARRREEAIRALRMGGTDAAVPAAVAPTFAQAPAPPPPAPAPAPGFAPLPGDESAPEAASGKGRAPHKRSRGFVFAVIASLCLVAATLGAAASMIWKDDKGSGASASSTTIFVNSTSVGPLAASLPAPTVAFSAVCPAAGAGWQLVPDWPGDIAGLTQYDVELQAADGTWTPLAPLLSSAVTVAELEAQPANTTLMFQITAVMSDGSRSITQPTPFTTPTSPC